MSNPALPAARTVFAAINSGDLSAIPACVTSDFVDHGSPFPIAPGPDGYTRILTWVVRVLQLRYEIADTIVTPDRIVFRAIARGPGVADVHGPAAVGREYAMSTVHIYRTEGDRLAEHWGVRDEVGAMVQIGVIPAPDPGALDIAAAME
ncbi:SnoaL-like polyketide cyclase [Brevibacterium sanguinis]|uniref:SnoaL-like polyketide cyclase n=2 Tax=Brevibacterium TaxID=1696 RepID=A0A366IGD4_9MICO|nr:MULTISPECIES: ester cyclase [Brevibacterium]RBP61986.1 SnoaL-like polyketide cyclase [Brevibacterium sanguinis]RBP70592.1 SnoaL-like polyketide cyclase [Brevibacterium celere]